MSGKYISHETAIKSTWMILEGMGYPRSENRSLERTVEAVFKSAPAADVVEVRHGRWHRFSKGSGSYNGAIILSDAFQCTICKESFWNKSNYCPSCGAKMDGDGE